MISFNTPTNLNGAELLDELAVVGIVLDKVKQPPHLTVDGKLHLDILETDKAKVEAVWQPITAQLSQLSQPLRTNWQALVLILQT